MKNLDKHRSSRAPRRTSSELVGYKPRLLVPMIDNSPKLAVAQRLVKAGKRVVIRDCRSKVRECMKRFGGLFEYVVTSDD